MKGVESIPMTNTTSERSVSADIPGIAGIPGQGPHMIILLRVSQSDDQDTNAIIRARYSSYRCPAAQACGEWVTEAVQGKTTEEARALGEQDVLAGVGAMPLGREHCPKLAIDALQNALAQIPTAQEHTRT